MFNVYFATTTQESAEQGDHAETGTIAEGVTAREALEAIQQELEATVDGGHWEHCGNWLEYVDGVNYMNGEQKYFSIHGPHTKWLSKILGAI